MSKVHFADMFAKKQNNPVFIIIIIFFYFYLRWKYRLFAESISLFNIFQYK